MSTSLQSVEFGWYIPTTGDGKYIGAELEREPTAEYMIKVAQAAEDAGYTFALIPTGGGAWIVGTAIATHTKILRPLVAIRPGLISPITAARMATTLDYISGGRAAINVVTGGTPPDLVAMGDPLAHDHDERYERTLEFMNIVKNAWIHSNAHTSKYLAANENYRDIDKVHFKGKHYRIEGGASYPPPVQKPYPPIYFGGSSVAGKRTAVEIADVYLMWPEPLGWIEEQIAEVEHIRQELKQEKGSNRRLRYGLRAQVLVRETEAEAWTAAWEIISKVDKKAIEQSEVRFNQTDAVGQKRQNRLRSESEENGYLIAPNLWAGLSIVRGGGAMMLVGTPEQVADRIVEYADVGISSFILSGYPNLEEAHITGDLLLPVVKRKLSQRKISIV